MHYLDHAATTPLLPEAREAMLVYLDENFGNPSSVHVFGRRARSGVEVGREKVAQAIGASPVEIVFTGGGTEADNLAIKGLAFKLKANGNHLVTTGYEHHAVLHTVEWLVKQGFEATIVDPEPDGSVDPDKVAAQVRPSTLLVSVIAVNNEIGTVPDLRSISAAIKATNPQTFLHTDAVQALGKLPVNVNDMGVDLASFSAHKIGGPKGVGALYVRSGVPLEAVLHGGGHERGLRSGTMNAAGAAGFGAAAEVAAKEADELAERLTELRDSLLAGMQERVPDLRVNGGLDNRVAGNLNVSIPGTNGETLLLLLDQAGIACSTGSACQSGAVDPSHVLLSIGVPRDLADGSLRFSLGRTSTEDDVEAVLAALPEVIATARKVGSR